MKIVALLFIGLMASITILIIGLVASVYGEEATCDGQAVEKKVAQCVARAGLGFEELKIYDECVFLDISLNHCLEALHECFDEMTVKFLKQGHLNGDLARLGPLNLTNCKPLQDYDLTAYKKGEVLGTCNAEEAKKQWNKVKVCSLESEVKYLEMYDVRLSLEERRQIICTHMKELNENCYSILNECNIDNKVQRVVRLVLFEAVKDLFRIHNTLLDLQKCDLAFLENYAI